ncbi:MAG: glycosyltransferase family 2 protein [Actinomycetia bacterium]|nr:glycosyltransferase family 2 protein [Actinomycetes bacterium]
MPSVIALVPAHNEEERIADTVRAITNLPQVTRVLVVDDGSTDATAAIARDAGAEVVRLKRNVGKGGALNAGFEAIRHSADIVLLLDADLGESAREARALLAPVLTGEADMSVGILARPAGSGGFGLVKGLARAGIRRLGGFDAAAPLSGQRALDRAALRAATPFAPGFGVEVAMTVRVLQAGLRLVEVPVAMTHAATGKTMSGFVHRGRQFFDVARVLMALVAKR